MVGLVRNAIFVLFNLDLKEFICSTKEFTFISVADIEIRSRIYRVIIVCHNRDIMEKTLLVINNK